MQDDKFYELQYMSLREEIKATKSRIFKTLSFGLTAVPATTVFAKALQIDLLIMLVPFIIVVVALIFLAENHALMRCGRYILTMIEPEFNHEKKLGWETWLSIPDLYTKRTVDRYLAICCIILFALYYIGSVIISLNYIFSSYSKIFSAVTTVVYTVFGIWFIIFLILNIKSSTTTKTDKL